MNKKTQQYLILAVILIAIGAVYYFFIRKPQTVLPTITFGTPTTTGIQQGTFAPDSFKLDLKSLNDPRLQTMTPPVYPQVQKSELGEQNPFKGQ